MEDCIDSVAIQPQGPSRPLKAKKQTVATVDFKLASKTRSPPRSSRQKVGKTIRRQAFR